MHALKTRIGLEQLAGPCTCPSTGPGMDRCGSSNCCGKRATHVKQVTGSDRAKTTRIGAFANPVDPAGGLENLRGAGIHVGRAVDDGAVLFRWAAAGVGKVMVQRASVGRTGETDSSVTDAGQRQSRFVPGAFRQVARWSSAGIRRSTSTPGGSGNLLTRLRCASNRAPPQDSVNGPT